MSDSVPQTGTEIRLFSCTVMALPYDAISPAASPPSVRAEQGNVSWPSPILLHLDGIYDSELCFDKTSLCRSGACPACERWLQASSWLWLLAFFFSVQVHDYFGIVVSRRIEDGHDSLRLLALVGRRRSYDDICDDFW